LTREKSPHENLADRWAGLLWLVQRAKESLPESSAWPHEELAPALVDAESVQALSDRWAKSLADLDWSEAASKRILATLAGTHGEFLAPRRVQVHARRAELLVLALDRLVQALPVAKSAAVDEALNRLFAGTQSLPDFDPNQFAKDLKEFHARVASALESK
jgi:hypothetical protein